MDTQAITVRLPQDVYEALRLEAFEKHAPQSAIIIEGLEQRLGLRPKDDRREPRLPLSREEFNIVMAVFSKVATMVRPAEQPDGAGTEGQEG